MSERLSFKELDGLVVRDVGGVMPNDVPAFSVSDFKVSDVKFLADVFLENPSSPGKIVSLVVVLTGLAFKNSKACCVARSISLWV